MRLFSSFSIILAIAPFCTSHIANSQFPLAQTEIQVTSMPSLADLLTIESSASIFYSYARELALSELFSEREGSAQVEEQINGKSGLTLLVPTNKAVMALARKPHRGPPPKDENEDITISDEEFHKISKENVQRWVEAHIIPASPLTYPTPTTTCETLLQGKSVLFTSASPYEKDDEGWQKVIVEDGIRILRTKQASNGVLFLIDGTISVD